MSHQNKIDRIFKNIVNTEAYQKLNDGQRVALYTIISGQNVFLSGGGGVGKSYLIDFVNTVIDLIKTATTGIAAINIKGQTIDSYLGLDRYITRPKQARKMNPSVRQRLKDLNILLIDEISMNRIDKFEIINARLQAAKGNNLPFGGVQIILVGDFCQLAPVVKDDSDEQKELFEQYGEDKLFAFESEWWQRLNFQSITLVEYIRQEDFKQQEVLKRIRIGAEKQKTVNYINQMTDKNFIEDAITICKTNKKADNINKDALSKIQGKRYTSTALITDDFLPRNVIVEEQITLAVGANVLICANNKDAGYYNGDLGTIVNFVYHKSEHFNDANFTEVHIKLRRNNTIVIVQTHVWENLKYDDNNELKVAGTFEQFPIKLGYAITGHKSQGMTLDAANIDLTGCDYFNPFGFGYVVLSRVRNLSNLHLVRPLTIDDINTNKKAVDFTFDTSIESIEKFESRLHLLHLIEEKYLKN